MPLRKLRTWVLSAALGIAGLTAMLPAAAADSKAEPKADAKAVASATAAPSKGTGGKLDNSGCQSCHDGQKGKQKGTDAEGEPRDLHSIDNGKYGKSVHSKMQCVACHTEIVDSKTPHKINTKAEKPNCISCHENLFEKAKKDPQIAKIPRLKEVMESITEYKKSFHARENADDETRSNASCNDCHEVHEFSIPPKGDARTQWRVNNPKLCGTSCHEDQLEEFTESIHGVQLLEEGNTDSAMCSDCHTSHSVGNTSTATVKQAITESCGDCHDKAYNSYERTEHGKIAAKTGGNTVRCTDCHGSHGVALLSTLPDTREKVKADNKMCIACHNSDLAFAKFAPLKPGQKADDKNALKEPRPNLDQIHKWLPNAQLHWNSVRCVDCHTAAAEEQSHEILNDKKAERKCVTCHTRDSALATRLYRHLAEEEEQKYGFANSIILANSYVIGATRHPLLDGLIMAAAALMLIGVLGHGAVRYLTGRSRRKNGNE